MVIKVLLGRKKLYLTICWFVNLCKIWYNLNKEIIVEAYGNFKNTESTYWTTHHFHYTLDDEGNVDDIVFDHTDK